MFDIIVSIIATAVKRPKLTVDLSRLVPNLAEIFGKVHFLLKCHLLGYIELFEKM